MTNNPVHIFLVDDDEGDRLLFTEAFSELKIKTNIRTFNDGEQLMKWLNAENADLPEFKFLDLNMPRKNGIACLKEIRSNERLKDIFVAIYSTSDSEKDMEETFLEGANIYITKPSNFNLLKELLYKAVTATIIYEGDAFNGNNFSLKI